jgi:hypothetical protein
LPAL